MLVLKSLHVIWINNLYNYFTAPEGKEIIANDWKAAYITEGLKEGKQGLDLLYSFASIDPLSDESESIDFAVQSNEEVDHFFASAYQHEDDDDENEEPIQKIFELIKDM